MAFTVDYLNPDSGPTWTANVSTWWPGQTFRAPDTENIILDKFAFILANTLGPATYSVFLYEWDGSSVSGPAIATASTTQPTTNSTGLLAQFDIPDYTLDASKEYIFYVYATSGSSFPSLSSYTTNTYSQGSLWQYDVGASTWRNRNRTSGFAAYFLSLPSGLTIPSGNFNEATSIAINLSGTYGGTGAFDIANPQQSGNNDVKAGKYGTLTVSDNGDFFYSVNLDKVKPLKTGETGVDEFTITLTAANGTVTSSTYRVDIVGDTGSENDGSGDGDNKEDEGESQQKSITIDGSRGSVKGKPGIVVDGETEGFSEGSVIVPYIKFPGQGTYSKANARPTTDEDGSFFWQRPTGKKVYVYFKSENGDVKSNRIRIPSKGRSTLDSSSLKTFDDDPIINGSSGQYSSRKKGKRRQAQTGAAQFGNHVAEGTNSSLLMATDSADAGFYKQHDLVAASSGNW